jgi:pimeloyl-ACP methyl ester carboxylesterase
MAVLVAAAATACGPAAVATPSEAAHTQAAVATATPRPTPTVDPTVLSGEFDIGGGHKLHLDCVGSGSPTIVLDVGNDDTWRGSWQEVFAGLREISRTCSYDRANLGKSDRDPGPRTTPEIADALVTLLQVAKVPGPYVFVGGSFGGNILGLVGARHPEIVAGEVFVDSEPATTLADNPFAKNIGDAVFLACCSAPGLDSPDNTEHIDYVGGLRDEIASSTKQPHVPAIVLTATRIDCDPAWPCDAITRDEVALQLRWIKGNPLGQQRLINTGHVVQRESPMAIVTAAADVWAAVRSDAQPSPSAGG